MNITLDDEGYTVDGRRVRRVSDIVRFLCPDEYKGADPVRMQNAAELGKHVDLCCRLLAEGRLDWDSVDERALPYVKGYEKYLRECEPVHTMTQTIVYHPELDYCGTMDEISTLDGEWMTVEWKRTYKPLKSHAYQVTAYSMPGLRTADGHLFRRRYRALLYLNNGDYELWRDDEPPPGRRRKQLFDPSDFDVVAEAARKLRDAA